jgi:peptide methionine sulfoxide reductase MsrA
MFLQEDRAAEVVQITYDKNVTNLDEIFKVFSQYMIQPLNRQGADVEHNTVLLFFLKMRFKKKQHNR